MADLTYCAGCNTGFEHPWPRCPICKSRRRVRPAPGSSPRTRRKIVRLADRDGWFCHLCREPIDPMARGDRAATLDHVVPRSAGGASALHNLKLAHSACNHRRGNAPLEVARA